MKIGQKLISGFLAIAVIVGVVGYIGYHSSREITAVYDEIVDETTPALLALGEIKACVNRIQQEAVSIALLQSGLGQTAEAEEEFEELQETEELLEKWEDEYAKVAEDAEEKEFVEQLDEHEEALYSAAMSFSNAARAGKSGQDILDLKEELEEKEDSFNELIAVMIADEIEDMDQGDEAADELASRANILIIAVSLAAVILAMAGGYCISRTISNPITKLTDVAKQLGEGDLHIRSQVKSKDEVGFLASSFNKMADEIQKSTEDLQSTNEELESSNEELRSTTEDLEASNEELRSTTEELEASNEELQSASEELEASNEELRTTNEDLEKKTDELRQAHEKLIHQKKLAAVGQLASGIGHELRNPLGVVKNAVYYIKTKVGDSDEKLLKHLNIMEREINNSNKIINDLLGFSRTKMPTTFPEDPNKIVEQSLEVVEVPKNVLLVTDTDGDLPKVMADKDQIQQVLVNLCLNGIQAMAAEGGQLKVSTHAAEDFVQIKVADSGCGVPEENLIKLFDPFFTTKAKGVGLGLAVTYGIIEKHKGTIEVQSQSGEGTTFTVSLPVARDNVPLEENADNPETVTNTTSN